ncbi:hypothetical protein [Methylobacterium sp. WL6]|uniref:hypothetical protein n=1 Tax=Methylobacterium sp. WL6 TaxID=2603901 RepID=UPI0011CA2E05|nr:hypothetical protein [Methylobacterium sp. WL6]TXN71629.1 hypothetical protein FV230_07725 [Methylobacterium sp. WL6]
MAELLPLLTIPETLEVAAALRSRLETARDARRAITGASTSAIASMAVLVGQFDAIAKAAAIFTLRNRDHAAWEDLQALLLTTGHLPLPELTAQEPTHGES